LNQTPDELAFMNAGVVAHNSGDLEKAEENYRKALAINPQNPDGLHLLGYMAYQLGFVEEAISLVEDAIRIAPNNPLFYNNLASINRANDAVDAAIDAYRKSVELKGDDPDVLNDLGNLIRKKAVSESSMSYLAEAEKLIRKAIALNPNSAKYHNNLGVVLQNMGPPDSDKAKDCFLRALELDPGLVGIRGSLGSLAEAEGDDDLAEEFYRQAIDQQPEGTEAVNNYLEVLGNYAGFLEKRKRVAEAIEILAKAERLDPENYAVRLSKATALMLIRRDEEALDALQSLMVLDQSRYEAYWYFSRTLRKIGRLNEAEEFITSALEHFPKNIHMRHELGAIYICQSEMFKAQKIYEDFIGELGGDGLIAGGAGIYASLGVVYLNTGTPEQVIEMFEAAMEVEPEKKDANNNYAVSLVALGLLPEGWERMRSRWDSHDFSSPVRPFQKPYWEGQSLEGKTIALWGEQGVGDEIRFASLIPEMMDKGANVIIECDQRLVELFARSFDGAEVYGRADDLSVPFEDRCDYQIPILDLARTFRPTIESFPKGPHSYLKADPGRTEFWRERLAELGPRPKVGVLWRSMFNSDERMPHYATVEEMAPVLNVGGVDFINLMYAECSEDRARIADLYGVNIHTWDDINLKDDQDDLASLISNLDVVVCPMTSPGILAGALDIPVLSFITTLRSLDLLGHPDAPGWLPSMRHFIKDFHEPWAPVMENIATEMKRTLGLS